MWVVYLFFFFFKQKTAYEMRISDWSSDVCSSDLVEAYAAGRVEAVITFASEGPALEASGARRIFDSRQLPGEIVDVLVVDRQRVNPEQQIGRASCRERVCQYVYVSVVAVSLKNNNTTKTTVTLLLID